MSGVLLALGSLAAFAARPHPAPPAPTVAEWSALLGPPSKPVALSERTRTDGEPVLVYWMQVMAAPLGVGPALPGTLVANFTPAPSVDASPLADFTFLAVADPDQVAALEKAVVKAGWVAEVRRVTRSGGAFRDLALALPDGRVGTLSIREGDGAAPMADGRPSPSLWIHLGPATGA